MVTHRRMGLVRVILLKVDAEGHDVIVLIVVGAEHLRPRRLPQLHLHGAIILHLHLHLLHPHP
jgi:hypothetical protein